MTAHDVIIKLKKLANTPDLPIGEAWNALDEAADHIEATTCWLRALAERIELIADVTNNERHAKTLRAIAKDVRSAYLTDMNG